MSVALSLQPKERTTLYPDPDISQSLKVLHSTFAALVAKMRRRLADHIKNQKIELIDIARYVEEFLEIKGLTNVESIDELFNQIRSHYFFLNCPVIECIAIEFLINNGLKEKMKDYLLELESFKKSTKLCELLSDINDSFSNDHTGAEVVLKFISQWENQTIKGLESFLAHYFDRSDLFNYIQVKRGCLRITFLVPYSHFQYLIDIATPKVKAMRRMGVLQLVINNNVLIDEKDTVSVDESLIEAMQFGDTFEVKMLLLLGADPDYNKDSAMSLEEGDKMRSIESQGKYA